VREIPKQSTNPGKKRRFFKRQDSTRRGQILPRVSFIDERQVVPEKLLEAGDVPKQPWMVVLGCVTMHFSSEKRLPFLAVSYISFIGSYSDELNSKSIDSSACISI